MPTLPQRKKTRIASLAVIVALIIGLALMTLSKTCLTEVIRNNLDGSESFKVTSIEEMYDGKAPTYTDTELINKYQEALLAEINDTNLSFEQKELGMVIDEKLYSIEIASSDDEEHLSFTLDKQGRLHVNDTETTYQIGNDQLYRLCESLFA